MIIFKNYNPKANAINAIKAAFDIDRIGYQINRKFNGGSKPINVNIGINSGSALLGLTQFKGSLDTRMTYTASGPVTNLAARLADYAQGGDILIGEETKRLVDGLWPVIDLGQIHIKGLEKPARIYSLKGDLH